MEKLLFVVLLFLMLTGCSIGEEREDIFEAYDTEIEAYSILFAENRGKFLEEYVIDDVNVRFKCLQFLGNVQISSVTCETDGTFRISDINGNSYALAVEIGKDKVITDFNFREGGS